MTVIYNMVSGEFVEQQTNSEGESFSRNAIEAAECPNLQLQPVETLSHTREHGLPADLAYRTFLSKR